MKNKKIIQKIVQWDKKIAIRWNAAGGKPITYVLKSVSFFGRETIWLLFLYYFLFIWYDNRVFVFIGTSFLLGLIIIVPIKNKINRKRPYEEMEDIILLEREQISKSFPSWHMYNIIAQGLTFGFLFNSIYIIFFTLVFSVFVGFSRIQLGVHYPSDVISGSILGIAGFIITIFLFGPLLFWILLYFEQISIHKIYHRQINPMLFSQIWYILIAIGFLIVILYSSVHKIIILRKRAKKD